MTLITLQPLSELLPQTYEPGIGREPIPGFFAEFRGKVWLVKSILERTAVLQDTENFYERRLGKLSEVMVDPVVVSWRADTGARFTDGGQPDPGARSKLRGRATLLTTNAKNVEARKRGNEASRGSSPSQRRWNRHSHPELRPVGKTPLQILREEGKSRCHACRHVGPMVEFNANGYCKPCALVLNRRYRETARRKSIA